LKKTWEDIPLIKPPKTIRIPDIVTIEQANQLFAATRKLSYKAFFFTIYSLGLRLGEGIKLKVGEILMPIICGCIFVTPRAIKTDLCHFRKTHYVP